MSFLHSASNAVCTTLRDITTTSTVWPETAGLGWLKIWVQWVLKLELAKGI